DTVNVPAGSCMWTKLSMNKPITLQGAGVDQTVITVNTSGALTLHKQSRGIVRLQNFSFHSNGPTAIPHPIVITGSWKNTRAVVVENNAFTMSGNSMFSIFVAGGVIFSHNTFRGGWNDY